MRYSDPRPIKTSQPKAQKNLSRRPLQVLEVGRSFSFVVIQPFFWGAPKHYG